MPIAPSVLLYHHEYGVDVFLHRTEAESHQAVAKLILDWIGDVDDLAIRQQILHLISGGRMQDAAALYSDNTNESFSIEPKPVMDAPSDVVLRQLADELIAQHILNASAE